MPNKWNVFPTDSRFAVVFDIDGTLANNEHRQHFVEGNHKNYDAFYSLMYLDTLYEELALVANLLHRRLDTVIVTGRPDNWRVTTEKWLKEKYIHYDALYMRKSGDNRDDTVVKEELLQQLLIDKFIPLIFFDDRKKIVDLWRSKGYLCCQVAEGDF